MARRPPGADVLQRIEGVVDRRALRVVAAPREVAIRLTGIEVVDELAAGPAGLDRVLVVGGAGRVGNGEVGVDPDEVDVRIGPEGVEREVDISAAAIMVAILGPVGRVGDETCGAEPRLRLGRDLPPERHRRIAAARIADAGQPDHLGADGECLDAACLLAQRHAVADEAQVAVRALKEAGHVRGRARDPPAPRERRRIGRRHVHHQEGVE